MLKENPKQLETIAKMLSKQFRYKQRSLPHEGIFWRKFHDYNKVLSEKDVKEEEEEYFKKIFNIQLNAFNAKRFVARSHDFCLRIKYLNKIFPDAYYIILNHFIVMK